MSKRFKKGGYRYTLKIVPAGYNFLGPGNEMHFVPTNSNDALAQDHDLLYKQYEDKGKNPYIQWNTADEEFLTHLKIDDVPTFIAALWFKTKSVLADFGVISTIDQNGQETMIQEESNEVFVTPEGNISPKRKIPNKSLSDPATRRRIIPIESMSFCNLLCQV